MHNAINSIAALVFVLALIGVVALFAKKLEAKGGLKFAIQKGDKRRLQIKEILNIDGKKKIVLVSRDDKEHLIAFSENEIEVIEKDIQQ